MHFIPPKFCQVQFKSFEICENLLLNELVHLFLAEKLNSGKSLYTTFVFCFDETLTINIRLGLLFGILFQPRKVMFPPKKLPQRTPKIY
jgi:hypothetical protein